MGPGLHAGMYPLFSWKVESDSGESLMASVSYVLAYMAAPAGARSAVQTSLSRLAPSTTTQSPSAILCLAATPPRAGSTVHISTVCSPAYHALLRSSSLHRKYPHESRSLWWGV